MHLDQVDDSDFRNLQSPHNRENWEETHFAGVKDGKGCTGGSPGQKVTGRTGVRAKTGSWHLRTETKVKFLFLSSLALGIDGIVLVQVRACLGLVPTLSIKIGCILVLIVLLFRLVFMNPILPKRAEF